MPDIEATAVSFDDDSASVVAGNKITLKVKTTPFSSTDTITFSSSATTYATVSKVDDRTVEVTGVSAGSATITATNGTVSDTCSVTVTASN